MANLLVVTAGRLVKPTRVNAVNLVASPRSSSADANPRWLGRHSGRPSPGTEPREPYVDLGPLDLTRRH
jgi:hypothetical protein